MTNDNAMIADDPTTWPTYADRVEMAYKVFEIGLWELSRDNPVAARRWLRDAVDYGVEDARPLLDICLRPSTSTPVVPTTSNPPDANTLGTFAADFAARPAHVRRAAHNWFPRRQMAILRSVALLAILTRELDRALERARELNRDRVTARDIDRDPARARELAGELDIAIAHAHDRALDLKRAVEHDRAGELSQTRDLARGVARDLARVRDHVLARESDVAHVLNPLRSQAISGDLARVRENALARAGRLAAERVIDPVRLRRDVLAHARSGGRDPDQATTLVADLVSALEHGSEHDSDTFDLELIEAVERLEAALTPATRSGDGREAE